jgi:hypothetical protein
MGEYDTALICLNGHMVCDALSRYPQFYKKFCQKCGAQTISACPSCNTRIKGDYYVPGVFGFETPTPAFCDECGKPYPWTSEAIHAAEDCAAEMDELDQSEKDLLKDSIPQIVSDTPATPLAAKRIKRLLAKAGVEGAKALKDVLVNVVSETVKKVIWPTP